MIRSSWQRCLLALSALLLAQPAFAQDASVQKAKVLFERFQHLQHAFDPDVADLYADEARIVSTRKYPGGLPDRRLELSGAQYKDLIRKVMGMAREAGDVSTYARVTYTPEGERVWIRSTRYSELKGYHSPFALLVGPDDHGRWLIFEEVSETRP